MSFKLSVFIAGAVLVAAGCSNDENVVQDSENNYNDQTEDAKNNNETEQTDDVNNEENNEIEETEESESEEEFARFETDSVAELLRLEPGIYSGDNYSRDAVEEEINDFPGNLTPQQFFNRLQHLIAEDFREEQELIDNFEAEFGELDDLSNGSDEESSSELNVQMLIDASGSMAAEMDGRTKIDIAKEAVHDFAASLPEESHVAIHVYGHKGSNREEGREESCNGTETIYPLNEYDPEAFEEALDSFEATGYTPIARAIEEAGADFPEGEENVIYIVSDGEETCDGDPVAAAQELQGSGVSAVVNIIGFDVGDAERNALEAFADAGEGDYFRADNAQMLQETFHDQTEKVYRDYHFTVQTHQDWQSQFFELADLNTTVTSRSSTEETRMLQIVHYAEFYSDVDTDYQSVIELVQERGTKVRDHGQSSYEELEAILDEEAEKTLDGVGD